MGSYTDQELRSKFNGRQAEPAITEIRFPRYKALTADLKITFTFPITALVGANGSNKSSILHALQAAPEGRSIADFWFSTSVDKIEERLSEEERHRFIYTYRTHVGRTKIHPECRKSRVTRPYRVKVPKSLENTKDPDYWEPTKISTRRDKMSPPPPSSAAVDTLLYDGRRRWKLIEKNVVYLDFRAELSAFDKYLYHSPFDRWAPTRTRKKLSIVTRSEGLARAFNNRTTRKDEKKKILARRELSAGAVEAVSNVLGKHFIKIEIIQHRFYSSAGYSARLHLKGREYSEAHAGSGEFAVIRMVDEISEADDQSLILLDEPEVSLHPGAQQKLVEYLKEQCIKKGHQVVISTHSPTIVNELPADAIKLLGSQDGESDVDLLSDSTHPSMAFFHLGHFAGIRGQRIVVEDDLVVELIKRAIRVYCPEYIKSVTPTSFPGGADGILVQSLPSHALTNSSDTTFLLDGDKRRYDADWDRIKKIPVNAENQSTWEELAHLNLGVVPNLFPNSSPVDGAIPLSSATNTETILRWANEHLFYLHGLSPESALLFELNENLGLGPFVTAGIAKAKFHELTKAWQKKSKYERTTSSDILNYQIHAISELSADSPLLQSIHVVLEKVIEYTNSP